MINPELIDILMVAIAYLLTGTAIVVDLCGFVVCVLVLFGFYRRNDIL